MTPEELARIKASALAALSPSLLQVDKDTGIYSLVGEGSETLATFEVEDVDSFNFYAGARQYVLALCEEVERLRTVMARGDEATS